MLREALLAGEDQLGASAPEEGGGGETMLGGPLQDAEPAGGPGRCFSRTDGHICREAVGQFHNPLRDAHSAVGSWVLWGQKLGLLTE